MVYHQKPSHQSLLKTKFQQALKSYSFLQGKTKLLPNANSQKISSNSPETELHFVNPIGTPNMVPLQELSRLNCGCKFMKVLEDENSSQMGDFEDNSYDETEMISQKQPIDEIYGEQDFSEFFVQTKDNNGQIPQKKKEQTNLQTNLNQAKMQAQPTQQSQFLQKTVKLRPNGYVKQQQQQNRQKNLQKQKQKVQQQHSIIPQQAVDLPVQQQSQPNLANYLENSISLLQQMNKKLENLAPQNNGQQMYWQQPQQQPFAQQQQQYQQFYSPQQQIQQQQQTPNQVFQAPQYAQLFENQYQIQGQPQFVNQNQMLSQQVPQQSRKPNKVFKKKIQNQNEQQQFVQYGPQMPPYYQQIQQQPNQSQGQMLQQFGQNQQMVQQFPQKQQQQYYQ